MSPTILREGPYLFGFFSSDQKEPIHIHVIRDNHRAKFWIEPSIELAYNHGFPGHELTKIRKIIGGT